MAIANKWVCVLVSQSFLRRSRHSVEGEMRRVFGKDFSSFSMTPQNAEDVYAFVRIKNYEGHVDALRNNPSVVSILNSPERPCFLTDEEVVAFIDSATPASDVREYRIGDMVKIVCGSLSGLVGMVTAPVSGKHKYRVLFKFHIRNFTEKFKSQDLEYITNIFRFLKTPVTRSGKGLAGTIPYSSEAHADERIKYRSKHRKLGKQKK